MHSLLDTTRSKIMPIAEGLPEALICMSHQGYYWEYRGEKSKVFTPCPELALCDLVRHLDRLLTQAKGGAIE
jgi:hypothetical protein